MSDALVGALILLPALAAVAAFVAGRRMGARLALAVALLQPVLVAALTAAVLRDGTQTVRVGGWGAPLGIELRLDGLGALLLSAVGVVGLAVTLHATAWFRGSQKAGGPSSADAYWPLWLFQLTAFNATFLSGDLFNLYVTLELLTMSAVGLIGLEGTGEALVAAIRYLIVALGGSLLYLLGVALTYDAYGTVDWALLGGLTQPDLAGRCALALLTAGLLVKTALIPLHFWLPPAHAEAPAPVSAVLSGLVLKASFFILLRVWFSAFPAVSTPLAGQLLSGLGGAAIVWGSIQAIRQRRVKRMIAYSTVAQIGYLFLLFSLASGDAPLLGWRGTAYLAVSHACAKAAAFLAAGTLIARLGSDEVERWRGVARAEPVGVFALGLAGVNLSGLPPSGGFIAKWLLLQSAVTSGQWLLALVVLLGGLLAAVYVFRVIETTLSQPPEGSSSQVSAVPATMQWPPFLLALAAIVFGMVTTEPLQLLEVGSPFPSAERGPS